MKSRNLCIIPARGGSKRIPRKNIKDFLGKPIISYSIETALNSNIFSEVMVSTDDKEIAAIALSLGASVPFFRSSENADDLATTIDVVREVINEFLSQGLSFENVCVIYPTAPFISVERLKEGYLALKDFDAAIPVVEFSYPIWRSFKMQEKQIFYQWPENEKLRSQDLPKNYHDAGQWYWIKVNKLTNSLVPERTTGILLLNSEVQDIDTLEDWRIAEFKYNYFRKFLSQ